MEQKERREKACERSKNGFHADTARRRSTIKHLALELNANTRMSISFVMAKWRRQEVRAYVGVIKEKGSGVEDRVSLSCSS